MYSAQEKESCFYCNLEMFVFYLSLCYYNTSDSTGRQCIWANARACIKIHCFYFVIKLVLLVYRAERASRLIPRMQESSSVWETLLHWNRSKDNKTPQTICHNATTCITRIFPFIPALSLCLVLMQTTEVCSLIFFLASE